MFKQPLVSIVANFYNSGKYIPKLIDSILNQTFNDWELICINDCSPGNDKQIINQYIVDPKSYGRIRLINNPQNMGIAKSKQIGIAKAKGKYITFIDGDDWLANQALEKMLEPAIKFDLDFVIMNNYKIIPILNKRILMKSNVEQFDKPIYKPELFDKYYLNFFGVNIFSTNSYWGKLYKRELFNKPFDWPQKDTYEDNILNFRIFPYINSMIFIDYYGYYYRWGGITSGKKNNIYSYNKIINTINDFYIERKQAIHHYNYQKASYWLLCELKNVLKTSIAQIAKHKMTSTKAATHIAQISQILTHEAYSDMHLIFDFNPKTRNDSFINAIVDKNATEIYRLCYLAYKNNRIQNTLKRILHFLADKFI